MVIRSVRGGPCDESLGGSSHADVGFPKSVVGIYVESTVGMENVVGVEISGASVVVVPGRTMRKAGGICGYIRFEIIVPSIVTVSG